MKCSCGEVANFSIRGLCNKCGKQCEVRYNPAPMEPELPTTARGKRRRENKKNK